MPLSLQQFVQRWKINSLSERSGSQSHFIDLCDMLGQPHPAAADAIGERFTFDKPVTKTSGRKGFADVWLRDHFAWEYKGPHKDLKAAYKQLNDYREDLGNPPLLVVCDLDRFEVHTNFTATSKRVYAFNLDDLLHNKVTASSALPPIDVLRALFGDYNVLRPDRTDAFVTQEAAKVFSRLAERLEIEKRSFTETPINTREEIAHFLMRILFCLFADSIGLLPDHLFRRLVQSNDRFIPRKFLRKLKLLFEAMSQQDSIFGEHSIKYFNGGLFDSDSIIDLDTADLGILYEVSKNYDWSHVAPEIFGTLFERSLNQQRRSLIGAHYTSAEDVLLLIEPVLMRPLERRWAEVKQELLSLLNPSPSALTQTGAPSSPAALLPESVGSAQPHTSTAHAPTPKAVILSEGAHAVSAAVEGSRGHQPASAAHILSATNSSAPEVRSAKRTRPTLLSNNPAAEALLAAWITELTSVRVLDPACGSGNFLYLALRRMLDLWLEARNFAAQNNISLVVPNMVSPTQLFGIEIEFYAHELASIVVWIGFLQWKHEHGILEDREPILQKLPNIEHADAILRYDADGKPYEPEWPPSDYIIGNPPFLGDKFMRRELGNKYVDNLRKLYQGRVPGGADLVTYWFEKARQMIADAELSRAGLLATQGIRGGSNRKVLERITETGNVFMAWADRPWILEGAAVRISIVGFDNGTDQSRILNGQPVQKIHDNLTSESETTSATTLAENGGLAFIGPSPHGRFDIDSEMARKMLSAPLNVNGRPNSDVVRPAANALDLVRSPRNVWTVDFAADTTADDAAKYELPFEFVRATVYPERRKNHREAYKKNWWIYGESRPGMRKALASLQRFIATPRVSKHRIFVWRTSDVLCNDATVVIAREDDYFFGVLHSKAHELWARAQGTQLREVESGFRYTPNSTFDTFPFPWPPGTEPSEADSPIVKAIADAARELVHLRDAWLNPPGASEADLKSRTLTNLYNKRPEWLANAHRTLDRAVFAAYGWPEDPATLSKQDILARLLALNHQRAAAQPTAPPARRKQSKPKLSAT